MSQTADVLVALNVDTVASTTLRSAVGDERMDHVARLPLEADTAP